MPAPSTGSTTERARGALDLCVPSAGSGTASRLFARSLARCARDLEALAAADRSGDTGETGENAHDQARFAAEIARLRREEPGALLALVRNPTVATLLRCLRHERSSAVRATHEAHLRALVFYELALRGALLAPARIHAPPPVLGAPALAATLAFPAGTTAATFARGAVTIHQGASETELALLAGQSDAYAPVRSPIVLSTHDGNPLALVEAHPDKEGNAVDLGGKTQSEWVSTLAAALDVIGEHLPELRPELDLYAGQIVPVGWDRERHLSASYAEAIGCVYLGLHPDVLTMAEALVHESAHGKLNALLEVDPVLENAFHPLFASPVRPDPRPLHGVLLAVHAFLPVALLYQRMIAAGGATARARFGERYRRVRRLNAEGAEVLLRHARPTPFGRGLLEEIRGWIVHFAAEPD